MWKPTSLKDQNKSMQCISAHLHEQLFKIDYVYCQAVKAVILLKTAQPAPSFYFKVWLLSAWDEGGMADLNLI